MLPLATSWLMIWLLIFNKKSPSISEISTSLLGMFYVGYLPSFWVRLRALTYVVAAPTLIPPFLARYEWLQAGGWSAGAVITWWTWTTIVFSDVGAFFVGTTSILWPRVFTCGRVSERLTSFKLGYCDCTAPYRLSIDSLYPYRQGFR